MNNLNLNALRIAVTYALLTHAIGCGWSLAHGVKVPPAAGPTVETRIQPWTQVPQSGDVNDVTVLPNGTIVGIGNDNFLWTRANLTSGWVQVPNSGSVKGIAVMPSGTIVGVGMDNGLWTRATLTSGWVQVPNSGSVTRVAVMPNGTIIGIGLDNVLWTRATLTSGWVQVPNSGSVKGITVMPNGTIVGIGMDNGLWTRATLTSGWVQIPASGSVIGVTTMKDGTILGIGMDKFLYTSRDAGIALCDVAAAELVKTFAPWLLFDRGASSFGFPMSAQEFFEKIDIVATNGGYDEGKLDGRKGGFRKLDVSTDKVENQNTDAQSLRNGKAPTYFQCREVGPQRQVRIKYWWFYGYQETCGFGQGYHHGDWEQILVVLNEARTDIAAITFSQHNNSYTRIAGPRDAPNTPAGIGRANGPSGFWVDRQQGGVHPLVFVEKASHGSFHDSNTWGPGGCGYWDGFRNPVFGAEGLSLATWQTLIDLDGSAEPWMAEDRKQGADWVWGNDGISTRPTQNPPTDRMAACEGNATYTTKSSGCFKSEALSGDDQLAGEAFKECKSGYTNGGLFCGKGIWPWEWSTYGRENYSYKYFIPTNDAGLTRRRQSAPEWDLPACCGS